MTIRTDLYTLAALVGLAGCVTDAAPSEPGEEVATSAPDDPQLGSMEPSELEDVPDGQTGFARLKLPTGVELVPYAAHGGHAIYGEDVDLGPIAKVDSRLRGGALTSGGTRWTDGHVQFAFHPDFYASARTTVRQAIAELGAIVPVEFEEVVYGHHTGPWIEFKWGPNDAWYAGMSTATGMMGCGEIHCSTTPFDCRSDCGQWIYFNVSKNQPSKGVAKHEILHALGLWHEQSRNDRAAFIDYNPECVMGNSDQFGFKDSLDLGPYDYTSIMHYSSESRCITNSNNDGDPYLNGCQCLSMTKQVDLNNDGKLDKVGGGSDLTREDVNTMWRTYNQALGTDSNGDKLASSLVVADFDGDGYDDVAVGAPGNDTNGFADSGAVFLFKGTSANMVPWRFLSQAAIPGVSVEAGDRFGAALAATDIDGDGAAELVIGVPGEDVGGVSDAGAIHVFRGIRGGVAFDGTYTQAEVGGTSEVNDQFGAALAIGNLTNSGPREIAVGAPGDRVTGPYTNTKSGAVYLIHDDLAVAGITAKSMRVAFAFGLAGDNFGAALAMGPIDNDANQDLVVGAPGNGGRVFVYSGRTPAEAMPSWSSMVTYRQTISSPSGGATDRFGEALFLGSVRAGTNGEVVVGAPGVNSAAGRVFVYEAGGSLASNLMTLAQTILPNGSQEAGDEFGASVLAFQRDSSSTQLDLVIGSPGENSGAGIITLYRGTTGDSTVVANIYQSVFPLQASEAGDRFGATLAAGQINGAGDGGSVDDFQKATLRKADLVVGAPGEGVSNFAYSGPTAGAFGVMLQATGGTLLGGLTYSQEFSITE